MTAVLRLGRVTPPSGPARSAGRDIGLQTLDEGVVDDADPPDLSKVLVHDDPGGQIEPQLGKHPDEALVPRGQGHLAYVVGPVVGARAYNATHSLVGPAVLLLGTLTFNAPGVMTLVALVWIAHIGFDRVLGYGLKYRTGFERTHLGVIGARRPRERS